MSVYGYARVSTLAQKTDRQVDALRGGGRRRSSSIKRREKILFAKNIAR